MQAVLLEGKFSSWAALLYKALLAGGFWASEFNDLHSQTAKSVKVTGRFAA